MKRARAVFCIPLFMTVLAIACNDGPPPRSPHPAVGEPLPLRLALSADERNIKLTAASAFQLQFVVENTGDATVDPQLERSSVLLVDGKPAPSWEVTIGNGPRDARWHALPARDRLELGYRFDGSLFKEPGDHTLVFRVGTVSSAPLTMHVAAP